MKRFNYFLIILLLLIVKEVNAQTSIKLFGTEISIIVILPLFVIALCLLIFTGLFIKDTISDIKAKSEKKEEEKSKQIQETTPAITEIKTEKEKHKEKPKAIEEKRDQQIKNFLKEINDFEQELQKITPDIALEKFSALFKSYIKFNYNLKEELTYDELKNKTKNEEESEIIENLSLYKYSGKSYTRYDITSLMFKLKTIIKQQEQELKTEEQKKLGYRIINTLKDPLKSLKKIKILQIKAKPKKVETIKEEVLAEKETEEKINPLKKFYYNIRYSGERKKIVKLINKGIDIMQQDPLRAKKIYSLALLHYYRLPIEEESNLVNLISNFYKTLELKTGKRNATRATKKLIKIKQKEITVTPRGLSIINRLVDEIRKEDQLLKENMVSIFKNLRDYEDKFLNTVSEYIISKEKKSSSFIKEEEENLVNSLKKTLANISKKRTQNLHYTKEELTNLSKNIEEATTHLKKLEKENIKFTKDEEASIISTVKTFFNYVKSKESDITNSINIFEKKLSLKEKEEFNRIGQQFKREALSFKELVNNLKDYVIRCEKEDYEIVAEEDVLFHNSLFEFLETIKKKEELGITHINNFEKNFVNEVKVYFEKIKEEKEKARVEIIEKLPGYLERNYQKIKLTKPEVSFVKHLSRQKEELKSKMLVHQKSVTYANKILTKIKTYLENEEKKLGYLIKEEERHFMDKIKSLNKYIIEKEHKIIESAKNIFEHEEWQPINYEKHIFHALEDYVRQKEKQAGHFLKQEESVLISRIKLFTTHVKIKKTLKLEAPEHKIGHSLIGKKEKHPITKLKELRNKISIMEYKVAKAIENIHINKPIKKHYIKDLESYLAKKEKQGLKFLQTEELKLVHGIKDFIDYFKSKDKIKNVIKKKSRVFHEFAYVLKKDEEKFISTLRRYLIRQEEKIKTLSSVEKEFLEDLKLFLKFMEFIGIGLVEDQKKLISLIKESLQKKHELQQVRILTDEERDSMNLVLQNQVTYQPLDMEIEIKKKSEYVKKLEREELKIKEKLDTMEKRYRDLIQHQYIEAEHIKEMPEEKIIYPKIRHTKEHYKLLEQEQRLREKLNKLDSFN